MEISEVAPSPERIVESSSGSPIIHRGSSVALDQWRGLALFLVLISHGFYFTGRVHGIGRVGVNLFFFISGVLVFRSLKKPDPAGRMSLARAFWKRRLKRLYPALATYLLAMLPLVWLLQGVSKLPQSDVATYLRGMPMALAYLTNYAPHGHMAEGHLWSLSCEMQFYLLAPLIFFLGGQTDVRRQWVWGTILFVLLIAGLTGPLYYPDGKYRFEQAVWPMMLGFFCEYRKAWLQHLPARWVTLIFHASLVILGITGALMLFGHGMKHLVIGSGALVLIPCFVSYVRARQMPGRIGQAFAWMGERTYSIYLWQQPFTICGYLPNLLHPVGALLSVFVGGVWFRLFERPFLSGSRKH